MQRIWPLQNGQFGSKVKNIKNIRKTILQDYKSCSVQKTARKNTKYSRNERILKVGRLAKASAHAKGIAFSKWPVWVKNYKGQKYATNHPTGLQELLCGKNRSKKH